MSDRSNSVECSVDKCSDPNEQAALLTELAELRLAQGKSEEAHRLFQQAYDVGLKTELGKDVSFEATAPVVRHNSSAVGVPANGSDFDHSIEAAASDELPETLGEAWDRSDDWEPDLSLLRKASSLQREAAALSGAAAVNEEQPANSTSRCSGAADHSSESRCVSDSWRAGHSNGSRRPSRSGGSKSAGGTPSRPRGRGDSRLHVSSDSDSEWDLIGAPSQPHIIEIYGLNRGVKTSHLDEFLLDYLWAGTTANIRWVDDEHALAVFPCAEAAQQLLDSLQIKYKVRPYNKASGAALQIPLEELTPPRSARPKTTTAVARRLISNALGNKQVRDRAAEKELADLRKANKQEKQQRQHMMESVWGDDEQ